VHVQFHAFKRVRNKRSAGYNIIWFFGGPGCGLVEKTVKKMKKESRLENFFFYSTAHLNHSNWCLASQLLTFARCWCHDKSLILNYV